MKQWDENDEDGDLDEDQKLNNGNPISFDEMKKNAKDEEDLLKMSKKNQNVMMFVMVKDLKNSITTKSFTEKITQIWQNNLHNNHINANVYVIEDNRAIFLFDEGSQSFEARNFLLQQKECYEVVLEGKISKGLAYEKSEL
ncbi:LDLR chaperone MESD [Strongyloides ratti]|uniref:LDLR chaperone MESD n=1 Tax=Strongyloides ratti TaxID=34506 RepID=A0A090L001_STRRB|nr:LDLR chaperone MESD [Strongyloides ratti]CEF63006.1 LDLR chaperone MESD [Strongyloides ratti]